jgi:VanZ family protein
VPVSALRRRLAAISRWYAVAFMLALIFALSSIPGVADPHAPALPIDKLVHAGEYAVLAFVLAGALRRRFVPPWPLLVVLLTTVAFGALYGASDEFHQRFVYGRDPGVGDWLADVTGSVIGAVVSPLLLRAADLGRSRG